MEKINQRGFTLVELSIVLVILGLLIGGVLTGQSLIRAAELRSVATQQARWIAAVHTFRDKYFALPGDMTNAQSYWGVVNATPATCQTTAGTGTQTCNGDGDGQIDVSAASLEMYRFWQHLANAGLIEGSYDGIKHGTISASVTAANSASGRLSSSLWYMYYWGAVTHAGYSEFFDGQFGNAMEFGGMNTNNHPSLPILKPEEAYNIDTKLDDGKPATGKIVISSYNLACSDTTDGTNMAANYLLSSSAINCALMFRQLF